MIRTPKLLYDLELISLDISVQNLMKNASTPAILGLLPLKNRCIEKTFAAISFLMVGNLHHLKSLCDMLGYVADWLVEQNYHIMRRLSRYLVGAWSITQAERPSPIYHRKQGSAHPNRCNRLCISVHFLSQGKTSH
jgi:hypothetical protein